MSNSPQFDFNAPSQSESVALPSLTDEKQRFVDWNAAARYQEPIDTLRERLASEWIDYLREQAIKNGMEAATVEYLKEKDSFVEWVRTTPEGILRKWVAEVDEYEKNRSIRRMRAACDVVVRIMFNIATNNEITAPRKVSMEELLASDGYNKLSPADQYMARYLTENCQRQNSNGKWTVSNPK